MLREEVDDRIAKGLGPVTPGGVMDDERFRLVVEGPPNWTHFREFWKMFYDEHAVVVASTYTKVGRDVRPRVPPRPGAPARDPGRVLPRLLHEPEPADAGRHDRGLHPRTTRRTAS